MYFALISNPKNLSKMVSRLLAGQIRAVLQQVNHGLDGLADGAIGFGPDRIQLRDEPGVALRTQHGRGGTAPGRVVTGDVEERLFDRIR